MNQKLIHSITSVIAVLLLAGCGSSGLGDIFGGGSDETMRGDQIVRGTVERVDTRNRTIQLRDADTRSSLRDSGTSSVYIDYDDRTVVEYSGQTYSPAALEPGDRIEARAAMVGNRMVAERITVTYDVSGSGTTGSSRLTDLRGTVRDVDTRARTISVQEDSRLRTGQVHIIYYESNTPVYWQGQTYNPGNLERGDVIDLAIRQSGNRLTAEQITVVQSATTGSSTRFEPDLRGTVQMVDSRNRTITIDRPTWMQRFDTGTSANSVTVRYDSSTTVEYNGQLYSPENLERGDTVEIDVNDVGTSLLAQQIVVVSNVRGTNY